MSTQKQKTAAHKNIKNIQRMKPGTTGEGDYYHVIVRPKEEFEKFRTQDVGNDRQYYSEVTQLILQYLFQTKLP